MKKLSMTAFVLAALTLAVTGCRNSGKNQGVDSLSADSVDSVQAVISDDTLAVDSFVCRLNHGSSVKSSIYIDYPSGTDALSDAVREFVASQLKDNYFPRINSIDEEQDKYQCYKGGTDKPQQMTDFYAKGVLKYLTASRKEMMESMESNESEMPGMEYSLEIRKVDETPKYVTYNVNYSSYTGGAHGSFISYDRNISKITCRPIEHSVDSTRLKALQSILRKGIVSYFHDCGEKDANASNLNSYLLLPEESKGMIPLPVNTPYIKDDSLHFIYQQYEIAPYAVGLVNFNVACKDIKPYLTKEAKALVE